MGSQKRKGNRRFAGVPHHVMAHPDYYNLSGSAVKLLLELVRQYNGKNNGKLCAVFSQLRLRGWKSEAILSRAIKELRNSNLIELTRQGKYGDGGRPPNYYALTCENIDEIYGFQMDCHPTVYPIRSFISIANAA